MNIVLNDLMPGRRRPGHTTFDLRIENVIRHEGERDRILVSCLSIHRIPVDRTAVEPGRGPRLQPAHGKTQARKRLREAEGWLLTNATGGNLFGADMNEATQEGATGKHNGATMNPATICHDNGRDAITSHFDIESITLNNRQILYCADFALHSLAIQTSIGLRARTTNGRTFFAIEHTELNACSIRNAAHQPIQCVDFSNEMSLA